MIHKVEIKKTKFDSTQVIVHELVYDDSDEKNEIKVTNKGVGKFDDLLQDGMIFSKNGVTYKFSDKLKFLENLKYAFSGSIIRAGDVIQIK